MGLLLSVMVVCVGVLELLACFHHARVGFLPLRHRRDRANSLDLWMEYFLSPIKDDDFPEQRYDNTRATASTSQDLDADTESVTPTNEDSKSLELTPELNEYCQENLAVECSSSSVQSESVIKSFVSSGRSITDQEHDESSDDAPIFKDVTRKELAIQRRRSYRRRPVSSTSSDGSDRASIRQEHHRLHRPPKAHSFEETTVEDYLQRQKHFDQERIKPNSEPETKIGQLNETMGAAQTRQTTAVAKNNSSNEIPFRSSPPELPSSPFSSEKVNSSPTPPSPQSAETTTPVKCEELPTPKTPSPIPTPEPDEQVTSEASESESKNQEPFWLIFSGEYTKAMSKDWHTGHFCCWQCDESLTGQRYVLRDDHPYCIKCYESVFANTCEECARTIGIDSKDLSYKDKHWHEACFLCTKCRVSLVDKQFGSKADKIYCGNCYDAQFASRCDGCGEIFRAGTKKMEYKTRQWHEKCFCCCVCKSAIGTKSFIPREQEIYCATCYEEKFATRCVKCNKIITAGGVTYKNEPWHRECFTCTHCTTSLAGQRFTSRDDKPYCANCFGELFAKRCTSCSKPITGIGGTRFISFEDRHWHNDCFICAMCKTSLVGRGFITDAEDIICPDCAKQKLM